MIKIRKAHHRGHADHGWLNSYHTFSFGSYHDPNHMGFADLRVINDDTVQPAKGFDTHPHSNMEIVTFVLKGELAHKDSMGNGSVIKPYEVQHMSAGTGITHSEYNNSETDLVHFLQVWVLPKKQEIAPIYNQKLFTKEARKDKLLLMVSESGEGKSFSINQNINIYGSFLNRKITHKTTMPNIYIHVHKGVLDVNGEKLENGDGAAITDESEIKLNGENAEFLLFEMM